MPIVLSVIMIVVFLCIFVTVLPSYVTTGLVLIMVLTAAIMKFGIIVIPFWLIVLAGVVWFYLPARRDS